MVIKPKIKNLTIAVLLLLYGLGFGFMRANAAYAVGASHNHGVDGHELNAYVVQVDLHIPQAQAKLANTTHLPVNSVKESKFTAAAVPYFDVAKEHGFKLRQHFCLRLLLNLRKAELLYPAHFFW